MAEGSWEYIHHRAVDFIDADMGGVMHFSNYLRCMESAEHAFFRSLDLPILGAWEGRTLAWPRVRVQCRYHRPLRFGDTMAIRVVVTQKRRRSLELGFQVDRLGPGEDRERAATGLFRLACVEIDAAQGSMKTISLPPEVVDRLAVAPPDVCREFDTVTTGG